MSALVCLCPSAARAQGDAPSASDAAPNTAPAGSDVEVARSHFQRGVQFYNAGDFKLSLEEFRRSYELSQNYRILYNIGQVQQQLNNYTKALAALERFLSEGGAEIPDARKTEVEASVAELKRKVAHVVIQVNVPDPEVWVDGFPETQFDSAHRLTIDPGDHRLELRKTGYQAASAVVTLTAGDTHEVRLTLLKAIPGGGPTRVSMGKSEQGVPWIGWVATGALAAGATVTGLLASSQANRLADLRDSSTSTDSQRDDVAKRGRAYAIACDVLAASALVGGGISLYLTLHSSSSSKEQVRPAGPKVAVGLGSVTFSGRF